MFLKLIPVYKIRTFRNVEYGLCAEFVRMVMKLKRNDPLPKRIAVTASSVRIPGSRRIFVHLQKCNVMRSCWNRKAGTTNGGLFDTTQDNQGMYNQAKEALAQIIPDDVESPVYVQIKTI